jgi:hypothetical protein
VNQNENSFVNFLSDLKVFFSKELCLRQFFNCHQFNVLVSIKAITFVSNLFEAMFGLQGDYENCRAKLLFQDDEIYHEMLRSSLCLFLPQNQELLVHIRMFILILLMVHTSFLIETSPSFICSDGSNPPQSTRTV